MSRRAVKLWCVALLIVVFAADAATPQFVVVAILFNAPIALSGLLNDRRVTNRVVAVSLAGNILAGYVDGAFAHYHWTAVDIENRILAALSFLLVGLLTSAAASGATELGELTARNSRLERERPVRNAIEKIRGSLNSELVYRAAPQAATAALDADFAIFYVVEFVSQAPLTFRAARARAGVEFSAERPPPEILSLVQRTLDARAVVAMDYADPVGRLVVDTLGCRTALAAPVADGDRPYGVFVAGRGPGRATFDEVSRDLLRSFVEQVATTLAQAKLFVRLAEQNEQLAAANTALAARSEVIRDIVYALSHDLRTPLVAAEMTQRQALAGAYGELPAAYLEILRRSSESNLELRRLAETLLMVARYESGDVARTREPTNCVELARAVAEEMAALAELRGVSLAVTGAEPVWTSAAASELRRALVNLVGNALTHTPSGGHVQVDVASDGERASIVVSDDGFGVPESARANLFERFAGRRSRRGEGSGLGLYIVRRIVEEHGGRVRYSPAGMGGSVFAVELPCRTAAVQTVRGGAAVEC